MKLRWSETAARDLDEAYSFLRERDPAAAQAFLERVRHSLANVQRFSLLGVGGRIPGTREYIVPRTRYIIIYRVTRDVVQVIHVFHSAREFPETD